MHAYLLILIVVGGDTSDGDPSYEFFSVAATKWIQCPYIAEYTGPKHRMTVTYRHAVMRAAIFMRL